MLTTTTPSLLQTVNVANNAGTAQQTSNVSLVANLPANATTAQTMTVPVYDTLGVQHNMTLTFTPSGTANQWNVATSFTGAGTTTATIAAGDNVVQFNSDGTLNTAGTTFNAASALSVAWDSTVSGGTSPQTVSFNLGTNGTSTASARSAQASISVRSTRTACSSAILAASRSIRPASSPRITITASAARSTSCRSATFSNPEWAATAERQHLPQTTTRDRRSCAKRVRARRARSHLRRWKNSTVDIATEFSNLIITQRAYEANSKMITTADQMLETLIQAKQ